ncbi:MAG: alpha-ribazole phosphatase family protein [Gammaproteobacteria bacterium]|nr:alpha-ribazole phosphatase family protein [Gammaproteobacteria bacterium]MDH5592082.1 alpha-ribazole phosphatase family protein [Gammaproteobacteria bacterium]
MVEITIDLLRHGDVADGKKLLGHTDEALTELGWQQLRSVIDGKQPPWTSVVTSPLQRCHAFSEELSSQFNLPLSIEPRFKEISFGEWDGQLLSELYNGEHADKMMKFWQNPAEHSAPEGEHYHDFERRVMTAWQALLDSLTTETSHHCLLVTHGGVIRAILRNLLGFPTDNFFRIAVPYGCLSRIKIYQNPATPSLIFHGGTL